MKYILIFFSLVFVLGGCDSNQASDKPMIATESASPKYQCAKIEKGGVSAVIKLPAQLAAYQEVSIFPKVNGYVKRVMVDIGSKVTKGSLLMELEAPELEQAAMQAKERWARAVTDYTIDREKYNRLLEASKTAGAISPLDLSTMKSKMQSDSALSNAEKANWQLQETMLGYLKVLAPFTGTITERNIHPGALVSASLKEKPMLELKEVDHLRLQVDIPEDILPSLSHQDTVSFFVSALRGQRLTGHISRKSNNVNLQFRSERAEIDVDNRDGRLSPGMYADVVLFASGNQQAWQLPKSAVVTTTERKYVLVMNGEKIRKVDVSTGNESLDKVEAFGRLQAGDSVIINATHEIKELP